MPVPAASERVAPLVSVPLLGWFAVSFCALLSFYVPLSVAPSTLVARGSSPVAAGWVTAVLVLHAVAAELLAPRIVAHTGPTAVAVAGLGLMALAGVGMATFSAVEVVLVLNAVRGFGFGLVVVVVAAQIAGLLPSTRRGEGLGWAGMVAGVPAVAGLPLGIWLADQHGPAAAGAAAALAAAAGLAASPLARRRPSVGAKTNLAHPSGVQVLAVARRAQQRRPATAFMAVVASAGVLITFSPSQEPVAHRIGGLAILVHSLCATSTRLLAGIHGDRHTHRGWLWFGLLGSGAGVAALALSTAPAPFMIAMALSGAAFGAAQSASLTLMLQDARQEDLSAISALWNASYDLGLGLGPLLFGMALVHTSSSTALMLVVCALAASLPLARRH